MRESQDRYLRLAAEYDNFRKRIAKERIELTDRAQAALVLKLTDILDDVDRIAASDPSSTGPALLEAITLVDKKLRKELEAAGLERLDPVGQAFDPKIHEAVSVLPPPTPDKDHSVAATFQVGFRFKGNLVRPARVQVYSSEGHA
ncbi:MAG: nucleotide exchange factor GrpE [Gemmatimonadales bacterium]|nr:nucleotide exchange factor GrpE [Gemmatimonadales bacterium]